MATITVAPQSVVIHFWLLLTKVYNTNHCYALL